LSKNAKNECLPYVEMPKARKEECARIITEGNLLLKKLHKQATSSMSRAKFLIALLAKLEDGFCDANGNIPKIPVAVKIHGVRINKGDVVKILTVKNLEWDILCSMSNFLKQLVNKTYLNPYNIVEWNDLYNEAMTAAVEAIHYYTKPDTKVITYVGEAVRRHLFNVVQKDAPMAGVSRQSRDLMSKFAKAKREAEQKVGHPVGFDELVKKLELNPRQCKTLTNMLVRVVEEQALNMSDDKTANDYTSTAKNNNRPVLELDQQEAIAKANLNPWETDVLVAFLESSPGTTGWQTEVAKRHINPATGKCFSRAAPAIALKRIKKKIKQNYAA